MTKISIARRRLESQSVLDFTQAELRSRERAALNSLYEREFPQEPTVEIRSEIEAPSQASAAFPLSHEQASAFESIAESPAVKGKEMKATFKKTGPLLVLRLDAGVEWKKRYLTSKDVSEMLAVSRGTIYRLVRDRRLTGYRIGRMLRFDFDEVLGFLSGCLANKTPEGGEG